MTLESKSIYEFEDYEFDEASQEKFQKKFYPLVIPLVVLFFVSLVLLGATGNLLFLLLWVVSFAGIILSIPLAYYATPVCAKCERAMERYRNASDPRGTRSLLYVCQGCRTYFQRVVAYTQGPGFGGIPDTTPRTAGGEGVSTAPRYIPKIDPTDPRPPLKISGGTGWALGIFGLVFFGAGMFAMTSPLWGEPTTGEGEPVEGFDPGLFVMSLFFVVPGLCMMLWRSGIIIDRREGVVKTWWGLLVPFKTKERSLRDFEFVTLSKEWREENTGGGGG